MDTKSTSTPKPETISRYDYETALMHQSVAHKRTVIILCAVIALVAALAVTETLLRHIEGRKWLSYIEQYDFVSYDQDGQGVNIIGDGNGVDFNGKKVAEGESQD